VFELVLRELMVWPLWKARACVLPEESRAMRQLALLARA
jgi:hypothetical protein